MADRKSDFALPTLDDLFSTQEERDDARLEKITLTLDEAAAYSGIGKNKLRTLTDKEDCNFVLWIGSKRLIKREMLDEYIREAFSI